MTRVYLPFDQWPRADVLAWDTAIAEGDVLDGRGPAHHWRPATRKANLEHYSRWLAFLLLTGTRLDCAPESRVSRDAVRAYVEHLKARLAPRTVVSSLVGLKVMMKAMAPEGDWQWLSAICNRLNRNAQPSVDKRSRMHSSDHLQRIALRYLDVLAKTELTKRKQLVGYRNGLMVALMAAHPLRRKNFAGLSLNTTIRSTRSGWIIDIPGGETKNRQPVQFELADRLVPYLKTYLERVRCRIATTSERAFWVSWDGDRMPEHSIYIAFTRITTELFGKSINPHLFRDCAATTLASHSLRSAMAAPGLLGHLRTETTEKHYIHASQLEASRAINKLLTRIVEDSEGR
jgi:site-specific recombinase XerD